MRLAIGDGEEMRDRFGGHQQAARETG